VDDCIAVLAACLAAEAELQRYPQPTALAPNDGCAGEWREKVRELPLEMKEQLLTFLIRYHILDDDLFAHCVPAGM
jgi:hypothetical protein